MNRSLFYSSAIFVLLFFYAAPAVAQPVKEKNNFTLSGKAKGLEGKYLYLGYKGWSNGRVWDSAKVTDGKFMFTGHIEVQWKCYLTAKADKKTSIDENLTIPLFMVPGNMTIDLVANKFYEAVLKGSKVNDEYMVLERQKFSLVKEHNILLQKIDSLDHLAESLKDSVAIVRVDIEQEALKKQSDSIGAIFSAMNKNFILAHPASIASVSILDDRYFEYFSKGVLDSLFNSLSAYNKSTPWGTRIQAQLNRIHITSKGKPAPLFNAKTYSGDSISLDQYRGKYVLIDFWGSWCPPCREALPGLIALYRKYHDKGIEFISVSVEDNEGQWRHSVKFFGIDLWVNIMATSMKPDIDKLYGANSYPTMVLIDPDGKVINNFNVEDNNEALPAILAKYLP